MNLAELALPPGVLAHQHADAGAQAEAMALQVAEALRQAIEVRGEALLVVSGGRSPMAFFECLARQTLDWSKVSVSLADERWVPQDHPDSNEALVRRHLLQANAASARMLGLYHPAADVERAAERAEQALAGLPLIDVLVLGMGEDGHTASLFPGSPHLAEALHEDCPRRVLAMQAPVEPRQRLSLTRRVLAGARLPMLAIQGQSKLETLKRALAEDGLDLPIRAFLRAPLQIHYCP
ncbi:6-phosphogluconolactonase [Pseudomonas sp. BMS12]|uniref:6-phosphogluconolactonase n=1 Tax=Pseudomonas sp. BMS12 TaxID=1796033 RepID=UPI00083B176C|nr:6-phosphogluconolactonase [Pseudomonas sp. BMS12]